MEPQAAKSRPIIGISTDIVEAAGGRLKADCGLAYAQRVAQAGGVPILLPAIASMMVEHAAMCDGIVLTGGDDPRMEEFGCATHAEAKPMHPLRQEYELALLRWLEAHDPDKPVLGICLGMQLMSLVAGGRLNQHLPETRADAQRHRGIHQVSPATVSEAIQISAGPVWSNHHQAMEDAGRMAVIARADDGVLEAVADGARAFYIGVQWHPERTEDPGLGDGVFDALLKAAARHKKQTA